MVVPPYALLNHLLKPVDKSVKMNSLFGGGCLFCFLFGFALFVLFLFWFFGFFFCCCFLVCLFVFASHCCIQPILSRSIFPMALGKCAPSDLSGKSWNDHSNWAGVIVWLSFEAGPYSGPYSLGWTWTWHVAKVRLESSWPEPQVPTC